MSGLIDTEPGEIEVVSYLQNQRTMHVIVTIVNLCYINYIRVRIS